MTVFKRPWQITGMLLLISANCYGEWELTINQDTSKNSPGSIVFPGTTMTHSILTASGPDSVLDVETGNHSSIRLSTWLPNSGNFSSFPASLNFGLGLEYAEFKLNSKPATVTIQEGRVVTDCTLFFCITQPAVSIVDSFLYEADRDVSYLVLNILIRYRYAESEHLPLGRVQFYLLLNPGLSIKSRSVVTACIDSTCTKYKDSLDFHSVSVGMKIFITRRFSFYLEQNKKTFEFTDVIPQHPDGIMQSDLDMDTKTFVGMSYHF